MPRPDTVRTNGPQPVTMVLRLAPLLVCRRMGIIEADQPLAVRPVQRERVVDAMRLLGGCRHACHDEPDPVTTVRVHHENLLVEVQKHIEGRVGPLSHARELSY